MKSKAYAVIGVGAVVAVSLSFVISAATTQRAPDVAQGARGGAAQNSGAAKGLASARREIAELRQAVKQLEGRSVGVEHSLAELASNSVQDADMVELEAEAEAIPEPASGLEAHFRYADGYRAYVVNERRDPVWANEKETELQTFFDAEGFEGYSLAFLECKATICAVELQNEGAPDPTADLESVRQYLGRAPFGSQSYWAPSERGLLVILSRDGHELPNPTSLEL